jgi:TrmH RNA methyltransferase
MRNKRSGELCVCGRKAVEALLAFHPEKVTRLFFNQERSASLGRACAYLASRRLPYRLVQDDELEALSHSTHHQGVLAMREAFTPDTVGPREVNEWKEGKKRILVLEDIGNSHNLGAIVRSAAFFGLETIVLCGAGRSSAISTSAYRVAEGGMEHVRILQTASLAALFGPGNGDFPLLGADHSGALSLDDPLALPRGGFALALGNEESGLSPTTRRLCSALIRISGSGNIESLNVAQAAAVFLSRMCPDKAAPRKAGERRE